MFHNNPEDGRQNEECGKTFRNCILDQLKIEIPEIQG
jgi:hypothetical protein